MQSGNPVTNIDNELYCYSNEFPNICSINYDRSKHTTQKKMNQMDEAETPDHFDFDNSRDNFFIGTVVTNRHHLANVWKLLRLALTKPNLKLTLEWLLLFSVTLLQANIIVTRNVNDLKM